MVRLSVTNFGGIAFARRQRYIRDKKGHYKIDVDTKIAPNILKESGITVEDAQTYLNPPKPEWRPTRKMPDDFRIQRYIKPKKEKEKNAWHLSSGTVFTEGIDQACLLTKTQRFYGLPEQIKNLVGKYSVENQDEHVKEAILQSQVWDGTHVKLPKYIDCSNVGFRYPRMYGIPDSKSAHILMSKLLRLSQSMCGKFPELATDRRVLYKPSLETAYNFRGEKIFINNGNEYMVCGYTPLPEIGDPKMIEESADNKLFDMYPILPTIDLEPAVNNMNTNKGAFKKAAAVPWSNPQVLFRINTKGKSYKKAQAYSLMTTFGVAVEEARHKYQINSGPLETPITVININMSFNILNFIVFQLNTLDFNNEDGIKNFAWFDGTKMFTKKLCKPWLDPPTNRKHVYNYRPPTYSDYNHEAFEKFLALYLYHYAK